MSTAQINALADAMRDPEFDQSVFALDLSMVGL